jgi:formylglycine-generating enzyme required for sulfatase activity
MHDNRRVLHGGSWRYIPRFCRSAIRIWNDPGGCYGYFGFRVVCVPRTSPVKKGDEGDGK